MGMNYRTLTDETLVGLTLLGENQAFEALVIKYQGAVRASAYSIIRNSSMSEDIMQDTFVGAWVKLDKLREPDKFGAWVCRIAKNKAKNAAMKHRDYISFDLLENINLEKRENIGDLLGQFTVTTDLSADAGEYDFLHMVIDKLSDKIKDVISMHYFEDATIDEISKKLNLPAGTVKRRLHDGREKIRKELGYMENNSKAVAKSVLEKIEKVKDFRIRWWTRDERDGFEAEYNNLMAELEQMPDTEEKYFYMADVLQLGWWWLPGENKSEMLEKVKEMAEKGNNTEILGEIFSGMWRGEEKLEYILNTLIPTMEKANMTDALGCEWFWLGYEYFEKGDKEKGFAAYNKVLEILPKHSVYYANAVAAIRCEKLAENVDQQSMAAGATGEELLINHGRLYFYKQPGYSKGRLYQDILAVFYHASKCDSTLYDSNLKVGESIKSSDRKAELKFVSDDAQIETACEKFDGCELWVTTKLNFTSSVYYKRGVEIVYISVEEDMKTRYCSLKKYNIVGGDGLVPFCEGNRWEYESEFDFDAERVYEVVSFNGTESMIAAHIFGAKKYSADNWDDMILQMRREYYIRGDNKTLRDVSFPMERAAYLADTEFKKVYTKTAADVMKRILAGDSDYNPDGKFTGHWNFFGNITTEITDRKKSILTENYTYSFEWKNMRVIWDTGYPLFGNDILGILSDSTDCIWDDSWCDGFSGTVQHGKYQNPVFVSINVSKAGTVDTVAGKFDNCIKIVIDTQGEVDVGFQYRMGRKDYYFAEGIGIVKCVHYFTNGANVIEYDLTSYDGTGKGYMPVCDGLFRRYEAMNLTDGLVGKAEYTFINDDDGNLRILENRTGIKMKA